MRTDRFFAHYAVLAKSRKNGTGSKYQNFTISRLTSGERYSINDCYINLAIIKEDASYERHTLESQDNEHEEKSVRNQRLSSFEAIHAPRQHFAIEQFFVHQEHDTRDPNTILVVGRAGIGKTTLCKWVLDGYDEVAQQVQSERRETQRNRNWKRLLDSIFSKGHVIITSFSARLKFWR